MFKNKNVEKEVLEYYLVIEYAKDALLNDWW
jgi:hypothetical protein